MLGKQLQWAFLLRKARTLSSERERVAKGACTQREKGIIEVQHVGYFATKSPAESLGVPNNDSCSYLWENPKLRGIWQWKAGVSMLVKTTSKMKSRRLPVLLEFSSFFLINGLPILYVITLIVIRFSIYNLNTIF